MIANTKEEIAPLRKAGKILADVLRGTKAIVRPGLATSELDLFAERAIRAQGALPAFLNYKPDGASYPYPAALCVSLNDEVVHGIPSEKRILKAGDVISLDLGLSFEGFFVDSAVTMCVGSCDEKAQRLLTATQDALKDAIAAARVGARVGDIGAAVERVAQERGFAVVEELGGHAVGKAVHEKPFISNEGKPNTGEKLPEGLVLALEPMFAEGKGAIVLEEDEWTYRMRDRSRAAHFEHTILLTKNGPEILTA